MFKKQWFLIVFVSSLLALAVVVGLLNANHAQAQPNTEDVTPEGITIPYTGQLSDDNGQMVTDGDYDFAFTLYEFETGGEPVWSETQKGVTMQDGNFTTLLGVVDPLSKQIAENNQLWLAIELRLTGENEFTELTPRQQLINVSEDTTRATSLSCWHTHLHEWWEGSFSDFGLVVDNRTGTGDGIRGYANSSASNFAGVYGVNINAGPGVYGRSDGGGPGIAGYSNSSFGVLAAGNDGSAFDTLGDLRLDGAFGEIFSFNNLLDLYSNGFVVIDLDNDNNSSDSCFRILRGNDSILWSACETSGITTSSAQAFVKSTDDYGDRLLYAIQGTSNKAEDTGTGSLSAGTATIFFDPVFAQMVNLSMPYQVLVTPIAQEPVWLYITEKTSTYFIVKGVTLDGGPAECLFDFRITAEQHGYEATRMEPFNFGNVKGE
jgi:hypothetical protein